MRYGGTRDGQYSHGLTGTWDKDKDDKEGGGALTVHGDRHRHATRGEETSGGDWWVVVADDVQVDGI